MLQLAGQQRLFKILVSGSIAITLVITPNINKDSIIIPKNIILFCLAMFFVPSAIKNLKNSFNNPGIKKLLILASIFLLNFVIILVASKSPLEQLIFGRTGRGLGLITFFSVIVITLISAMIFSPEKIRLLLGGIITAGLLASFYGILQYFNLDLFDWDTRTNGVIGTIGNPNFLSSFAAMIFVPTVVFFWKNKFTNFLFILLPLIFFTIYITKSTQGYVTLVIATLAYLLVFFWYKQKLFFIPLSIVTFISVIISIFGALGHGPLSYFLYKISVQSRGDFWRSAVTTGTSHPIFGVGFDSFGDYSLLYRDQIAASHSFAEYTDSAHNYYLDYLVTGGFPFMLLNILLSLFVLSSFLKVQKKIAMFDKNITALFCVWLVYQLQSLISPMSVVFMVWNAVVAGATIAMVDAVVNIKTNDKLPKSSVPSTQTSVYAMGLISAIIGLVVMFPLFNSDRLQLKAIRSGNGDLLIQSVTMYPESVLKYSQAGRDLLTSGLSDHSLYLARKAIEFNPNSAALWALILINPKAPINERLDAKEAILNLDPLNTEVRNFKLDG